MTYSVYQVDAFTTSIFKGNPACVVPLDKWFRDEKCKSVLETMDYLPSVVSKKYIKKIIDLHNIGFSNGHRLFSVLMLSLASMNNDWHKM